MAVYAAHLTRTLQGAPSVFQVTAADALGATLKPALGKLVEYLAAVYPHKCGWLERWYDELYLLFDCCLQYHYLKHYAASFAESFYGLVRVPQSPSGEFSGGARLPAGAERASLALLALAPYLAGKAAGAVQRWRQDDEDGRLGKSVSASARRCAIHIYSVAQLVVEGAKLVQLGRYVAGAGGAHCPQLGALRLALRDAPPREQGQHTWGDLASGILSGHIRSIPFPLLGGLLLRLVECGAFAVQAARWGWGALGAARAPHTPQLPPPAAPQRSWCSARYRNRCPVCLQPWRTPTVLPVSGLVFCYSCISSHVRSRAACPVTRLPATEQQLVRMYCDQ